MDTLAGEGRQAKAKTETLHRVGDGTGRMCKAMATEESRLASGGEMEPRLGLGAAEVVGGQSPCLNLFLMDQIDVRLIVRVEPQLVSVVRHAYSGC